MQDDSLFTAFSLNVEVFISNSEKLTQNVHIQVHIYFCLKNNGILSNENKTPSIVQNGSYIGTLISIFSTWSSSWIIFAGISLRMIFPNMVSPPACAVCALATSSAMLALFVYVHDKILQKNILKKEIEKSKTNNLVFMIGKNVKYIS